MSSSSEDVSKYLLVLQNPKSQLAEKREAFRALQSHFAPIVNHTPAYAQELSRVFGLRFERWETPPSCFSFDPIIAADMIRGLVFGAALGDSMGLATEFMTRPEISKYYPDDHTFQPGSEVYSDMHRLCFPKGDWTDDTDQLILILQTFLEHGGMFHGPTFASKLNQWVKQGFSELGDESGAGLGRTTKSVIAHSKFLVDPQQAAQTVWHQSGKKAAPNGAVMRTAVTGVPFFWNAKVVQDNTVNFCKCTHADPRCIVSCIVIAECVRNLLIFSGSNQDNTSNQHNTAPLSVGNIIDIAIARAEKYLLENVGDKNEIQDILSETRHYASIKTLEELDLDAAESIGYTFKCMGTGLWALREIDKFCVPKEYNSNETTIDKRMASSDAVKSILQQVVRAGGDSDTNATVAGALLGARVGYSGLPINWIMNLPYVVWLEAWLQKLLFMLYLPTTMDGSNGVPRLL